MTSEPGGTPTCQLYASGTHETTPPPATVQARFTWTDNYGSHQVTRHLCPECFFSKAAEFIQRDLHTIDILKRYPGGEGYPEHLEGRSLPPACP